MFKHVTWAMLPLVLLAATGCRRGTGSLPASSSAGSLSTGSTDGGGTRDLVPATGFYGGGLTLLRQPDGSLQGAFGEEQGTQPSFSCGFLLSSTGPVSPGHRIPLVTWWPDRELNGGKSDEVTTGTLFVQGDSVSLQLPKQAHGGCWNVEPGLDQGEVTEIGTGTPHPEWKILRVVASDKLQLHHHPDANDFTKAYVVRGDTLALLSTTATDGVWQHVQLLGFNGPGATGWVLDSGLLPWSVPTH